MEIIENLYLKASGFILQNELVVAIGLPLVIVALWFQVRLISRIGTNSQRMSIPEIKRPSSSEIDDAQVVVAPSQTAIKDDVNAVDSMFEEARLYAIHGRLATAVEILQEVVKLEPSKAAPWSLLLSSYSSLGKAVEFEETAGELLKHHKDSRLWRGVQALGRTLDPNNPLYVDNIRDIFATPKLPNAAISRRPVGDILIEMGVLNEQVLQGCLDTFDPKKHGRLGGYLLACKKISTAQLNQALLLQQGGPAQAKSPKSPHNMAVAVCDDSSQLRSICGC